MRSAGVNHGILGVLQAEHDLTVRLRAFPHLVNLRVIVDSQRCQFAFAFLLLHFLRDLSSIHIFQCLVGGVVYAA